MRNRSHHAPRGIGVNFEESADVVLEVGDSSDDSHKDGEILVLREAFVAFVDGGRQQPVLGSGEGAFEVAGLASCWPCGFSEVAEVHFTTNN